MMTRAFRPLVCVGLVFALAVTLIAKGPTSRITISGGDLPQPVEIIDPQLLKDFQVWSGPGTGGCVRDTCSEGTTGFIVDWSAGAVPERPTGLRRYEVSFYATDVRFPDRRTEHLAYVVTYEYDPTAAQGYVYLPGKGDQWYSLNARSIYRGKEGKWFRATGAWQDVVVPLLSRRQASQARR